MGLGPWYRLGLSLGNCLLLLAIIETGLTFNSVFHGLAIGMCEYMYGLHGSPPGHLATDLKEYPQYVFLMILYALQISVDALLWLVLLCKLNKHVVLMWVFITAARTFLSAYLSLQEEWGSEFDAITSINYILSFLWGSILFLFKMCTGIQGLVCLVTAEDPAEKMIPAGQGYGSIKDYYVEHLKQLSVVLLISEIIMNIYRSLNDPNTAFLIEAKNFLDYDAPDEYGRKVSLFTVIVIVIGLILLSYKSLTMRRSWIGAYVITILIHFILFVYVVIDWTSATAHPQMFNGFVFVSLTHLIYKVFILYIYFKTVS